MHPRDPRQVYRQQQMDGAGTDRLLAQVYRHAIHACETGRRKVVVRALEELMGGLDLEKGDLALSLLRMYEYMLHQAREGDLDSVERNLRELLTAWEGALAAPSPSSSA